MKYQCYFVGKWEGYFKDPRGFDVEKKWPIDVIFSFKANGTTFAAFGVDEIGTFEFKDGKIEGKFNILNT